MLWSCVRGARSRSGESGPVPVLASLLGLLPALVSLAVRVAGCPAPVSLPFACRYAIPRGLCVPRARSGRLSGPSRMSVAGVCAPAPAAYAPPRPGRWARALRAVPVQRAGRAVPRGLCPSAFPAPVRCSAHLHLGGMARSLRPRAWLLVARPLVGGPVRPGRFGAWRLEGGSVCRPPLGSWLGPGRSRSPGGGGRGVALPRSVPLPPLSGHQGRLRRRLSVHGGCGLHTAPVPVCAFSSGRGPGGAVAYRQAAGRQVNRPAGAAACPGHSASGRVTVQGRAARGPSGARPRAPGPSRGGAGGGLPLLGGGVQSRSLLAGLRHAAGGGAGRARVPRRPPSLRTFEHGFTVDCFDDIVLFMPLLAPAAS